MLRAMLLETATTSTTPSNLSDNNTRQDSSVEPRAYRPAKWPPSPFNNPMFSPPHLDNADDASVSINNISNPPTPPRSAPPPLVSLLKPSSPLEHHHHEQLQRHHRHIHNVPTLPLSSSPRRIQQQLSLNNPPPPPIPPLSIPLPSTSPPHHHSYPRNAFTRCQTAPITSNTAPTPTRTTSSSSSSGHRHHHHKRKPLPSSPSPPVLLSPGLSPLLRGVLPHPKAVRPRPLPTHSDLSAASTRAELEPTAFRDLRRVTAPTIMLDPAVYEYDPPPPPAVNNSAFLNSTNRSLSLSKVLGTGGGSVLVDDDEQVLHKGEVTEAEGDNAEIVQQQLTTNNIKNNNNNNNKNNYNISVHDDRARDNEYGRKSNTSTSTTPPPRTRTPGSSFEKRRLRHSASNSGSSSIFKSNNMLSATATNSTFVPPYRRRMSEGSVMLSKRLSLSRDNHHQKQNKFFVGSLMRHFFSNQEKKEVGVIGGAEEALSIPDRLRDVDVDEESNDVTSKNPDRAGTPLHGRGGYVFRNERHPVDDPLPIGLRRSSLDEVAGRKRVSGFGRFAVGGAGGSAAIGGSGGLFDLVGGRGSGIKGGDDLVEEWRMKRQERKRRASEDMRVSASRRHALLLKEFERNKVNEAVVGGNGEEQEQEEKMEEREQDGEERSGNMNIKGGWVRTKKNGKIDLTRTGMRKEDTGDMKSQKQWTEVEKKKPIKVPVVNVQEEVKGEGLRIEAISESPRVEMFDESTLLLDVRYDNMNNNNINQTNTPQDGHGHQPYDGERRAAEDAFVTKYDSHGDGTGTLSGSGSLSGNGSASGTRRTSKRGHSLTHMQERNSTGRGLGLGSRGKTGQKNEKMRRQNGNGKQGGEDVTKRVEKRMMTMESVSGIVKERGRGRMGNGRETELDNARDKEVRRSAGKKGLRDEHDEVSVMSALTNESDEDDNGHGDGDVEMGLKMRLRSMSEAAAVHRRMSLVQTKEKVMSVWGRLKNKNRQRRQQQQHNHEAQYQRTDSGGEFNVGDGGDRLSKNSRSPWLRFLSTTPDAPAHRHSHGGFVQHPHDA